MNKELHEQINVVIEARRRLVEAKTVLQEAVNQWEVTTGSYLQGKLKEAIADRDTAEELLRNLALADFALTGNKAPAPGVGVRIVTRLVYLRSNAFAWAEEHEIALELDEKAFEKIAKANPLPFVTIEEIPQATIATDLTAAVAEIEKEAHP